MKIKILGEEMMEKLIDSEEFELLDSLRGRRLHAKMIPTVPRWLGSRLGVYEKMDKLK